MRNTTTVIRAARGRKDGADVVWDAFAEVTTLDALPEILRDDPENPVVDVVVIEQDCHGREVRILGKLVPYADEDEEVALYRREAREASLSEAYQLVQGLEILGDPTHTAAITAVADKLREYLELPR